MRRATRRSVKLFRQNYISIHALLAESDANWFDLWGWAEYFYPRSPCGERRQAKQTCRAKISISIHALLAESDVIREPATRRHNKFLSTLSLRRATNINSSVNTADKISIHALLAESDRMYHRVDRVKAYISIHALLAESDTRPIPAVTRVANFYPRSPCGERRIIDIINNVIDNFYPRSPCGERPL